MKSSNIAIYASAVLLSFGCNGSRSDSSNSATSDSCDLASARQAHLDGYAALQPADYVSAIKHYTQAAEGYQACLPSLKGADRAQAQYDEGMALWGESIALTDLKDSRADDVMQNAVNQFVAVSDDSAANVLNTFYLTPSKNILRSDASRNVKLLQSELEVDAKLKSLGAQQATSAPAGEDNSGSGLQTFSTEDDAQANCPEDTVVWLNLSSGIYHMKGERWYGTAENGAYVCQQEADAAGDRQTENGQ